MRTIINYILLIVIYHLSGSMLVFGNIYSNELDDVPTLNMSIIKKAKSEYKIKEKRHNLKGLEKLEEVEKYDISMEIGKPSKISISKIFLKIGTQEDSEDVVKMIIDISEFEKREFSNDFFHLSNDKKTFILNVKNLETGPYYIFFQIMDEDKNFYQCNEYFFIESE